MSSDVGDAGPTTIPTPTIITPAQHIHPPNHARTGESPHRANAGSARKVPEHGAVEPELPFAPPPPPPQIDEYPWYPCFVMQQFVSPKL